MNRRFVAVGVVVAAAAVAVLVGVVTALASTPVPETATPGVAGTVGLLLGVVALLVAVFRARGDPGPGAEPPAWTEGGRLVDRPPEETPEDVAVSGTETTETFAAATRAARSAGDVQEGVEQVRPHLRQALGSALVAGGRDPETVERALADGTWTDDDLAAAVLDEAVDPPRRNLRERVRDWLFPEHATRERTRRAVAAVDEVADETLPAVVGEDAPRTVPVVAPTLEDLQRTADGRLQRAEAVGDGRRRHERPGGGGSEPTLDETSRVSNDTDSPGKRATDSTAEAVADWDDVRGAGR